MKTSQRFSYTRMRSSFPLTELSTIRRLLRRGNIQTAGIRAIMTTSRKMFIPPGSGASPMCSRPLITDDPWIASSTASSTVSTIDAVRWGLSRPVRMSAFSTSPRRRVKTASAASPSGSVFTSAVP